MPSLYGSPNTNNDDPAVTAPVERSLKDNEDMTGIQYVTMRRAARWPFKSI